MNILDSALVILVIILPSNKIFFLSFTKQLLRIHKYSFGGTVDGFAFENLDDGHSIINIECMSDTCDGIKKLKMALPVTFDQNVFV